MLDKSQVSINMRTSCREDAMFGDFSRQKASMSTSHLTTDAPSARIKHEPAGVRP